MERPDWDPAGIDVEPPSIGRLQLFGDHAGVGYNGAADHG
jgi:hypothetical protein